MAICNNKSAPALVLLLGGGDVRALLRGMARRAGPPVPVVPQRIVRVVPLVRRGAVLLRALEPRPRLGGEGICM